MRPRVRSSACAEVLAAAWLVLHSPRLWPEDCNQNGVEDFIDVTSGASRDCNGNDVPDECDIENVNYGLSPGLLIPQEAGTSPVAISAEDYDGDGDLDLAVGNVGRLTTLAYWSRLPNGDYTPGQEVLLTDSPRSLEAADLDGDGDIDLVLAGDNLIQLLENQGQRFEAAGTLIPDFHPTGITTADFDGDGDADIVLSGSFALAVYWNTSAWAFEPGPSFVMGSFPNGVLALDLDGDLDPDIATVNQFDNTSVIFNLDGQSFAEPRNYAAGAKPSAFTALDIDEDGDPDFAVAGSEAAVLLNSGKASFPDLVKVALPMQHAACVVAGDLDSDGAPDLVFGFGALFSGLAFVSVHAGDRLSRPRSLSTGTYITAIAALAADLEGDGGQEVIVANFESGNVAILKEKPSANARDCDQDRLPDDCELEGNDCNRNGIPDHCDLAAGTRDCNSNGAPDECEPDCNRNGLADECDIATGKSLDVDGDGFPDECPAFHRGDVNRDGLLNLTDPVYWLLFLFNSGDGPQCFEAADFANDGQTDITDAVEMLVFLFQGGPGPAPPGPPGNDCGSDPDPPGSLRALGCESYGACP